MLKSIFFGKFSSYGGLVSTLENRLSGDNKRPLLKGGDLHGKIISLMEKRQAIYEQTSDLIVKTDGLQCIDVVKIIKEEK